MTSPRPPAAGTQRSGPEAPPRFLRRRRAEALAALIPLAALVALMPPFVWVFAHDGRLFGAPAALLFLLALWVAVILATRAIARRLTRPDSGP